MLHRLLRCESEAQRRAFFAESGRAFEMIPAHELHCLSDPGAFVSFLSGTFYTRAFNAIRGDGRIVRKQSEDKEKLRKEHDFWYLLPPDMQRFVVQPFHLEIGERVASYEMERLNVPDLALLWVHGAEAVPGPAFEKCLDAVFDWVENRPRKRVSEDEARAATEALVVDKLERRIETFLRTEIGQKLDDWIRLGTSAGDLRSAAQRVRALVERLPARSPELAITHGDLCFSNILFDKRSGLVKFIDPRGASQDSELWSDPTYDVAKFSHSVLGGYDFIHHGLFEVAVSEALELEIRVDRPPIGPREEAFRTRLANAGFDEARVRLYEASLFLSMLPLHADSPRKVMGFALTGLRILGEVEQALESGKGLLAKWLGR
jgi:hypothetical protein